MSICAALASGVAGTRLQGRSPRAIIGGGMLLIAVGSLVSGLLITDTASWPALIPGYTIVGLGVGLVMPTLASSAMNAVPIRRGGMAAGSLTTARQLGFALGVAVLGTVFAARATDHAQEHGIADPSRAAHALAAGQAGRILEALPEQARPAVSTVLHGAAAAGLEAGFVISAGVGLVGVLAVFLLVRPARRPAEEPDLTPVG